MQKRRRKFLGLGLALPTLSILSVLWVSSSVDIPASAQSTPGTASLPDWGDSKAKPLAATKPSVNTTTTPKAEVPWKNTSSKPFSEKPFVMSLCQDKTGAIWVGTEGEGVWRYDPSQPADEVWHKYIPADGLGDEYVYALACDHLGRVWVGHLNHGVSVFNGQKWQNYEVVGGLTKPDTLSGPLGERIYDISVCPTDGDVWIASNVGLSRYSEKKNDWTYYTRLDGLPSNQPNTIAFDNNGNIYVGTKCDGLAMAAARDNYQNWRTVRGDEKMLADPSGEGLPSNLINDILVSQDGTVYVATTTGLAWSVDGGNNWRYVRGKDWADKVRGLFGGPPQGWTEANGAPKAVAQLPWEQNSSNPTTQSVAKGFSSKILLAEDYVTCLAAEPGTDNIWIGYRQQGCECYTLPNAKILRSEASKCYINSIIILNNPSQDALIGSYGDVQIKISNSIKQIAALPSGIGKAQITITPLPEGAKPPSVDELAKLTQKSKAKNGDNITAVYLGEDWSTQGDWVGRYGYLQAILCAASTPIDHDVALGDAPDIIHKRLGRSADIGDGVRHYLRGLSTDDPRSLWDPFVGYRRQGEWDDHGEIRPLTREGPDLCLAMNVPKGLYRISVYFVNVNRQVQTDRRRDYLIQIKPGYPDIKESYNAPSIAEARVNSFNGGVYQQFVVKGPSEQYLIIRKNNSLNAICSGVFIDKLTGDVLKTDKMPRAMMGGIRFDPQPWPEGFEPSERLGHAINAWNTTSSGLLTQSRGFLGERPLGILAYRLASSEGAPAAVLEKWRWSLPIWANGEHDVTQKVMLDAWWALLKANPRLSQNPNVRQK